MSKVSTENQLLKSVEAYVSQMLETQLPPQMEYHTLEHTRQVVFAVREIAVNTGIGMEDMDTLVLAAWFHDLGYVRIYEGHEVESQQMAGEFLETLEVEPRRIEQIKTLIAATSLEVEPTNLLEQVIKDADLYNLATPQAYKNSQKLRREWAHFRNMQLSDEEWEEKNLQFFKQHQYYTHYAQTVLSPRKERNIKRIKKKIKKSRQAKLTAEQNLQLKLFKSQKEIEKLEKKLQKTKELRPDRGIETMFRTTYRVHISLSSIADNKANILLSINAIIISVITTSIFSQFEDYPSMLIPALLIMAVCLSTIVFAILSTRPKVNSGIFTREDILEKRTNLLFFGNFHAMPLNDYLWGIGEMMKDKEYLYGSMAKDIYFLGKVLAKKFQLLRIAYNIFMYGMIISVLAFGLAFWLASGA